MEPQKFFELNFPHDRATLLAQPNTTPDNYFLYQPSISLKHLNFTVLNPLKPGHSRASLNVKNFNNFLFEFDTLPLDRQLAGWKNYAAVHPLASLTFSGSKSLHAVISLADTPPWAPGTPEGINGYKTAWLGLYRQISDFFATLGEHASLDTSTKDPARLTRTPGAERDGVIQELLYTGNLLKCVNLPKCPVPASAITAKAVNPDNSLRPRILQDVIKGGDFAGIRTKIAMLKASAAPAGFYPEIFRLSLWILEATGAPYESTAHLLETQLFPELRAAGYTRDLLRGVKDAYIFKGFR